MDKQELRQRIITALGWKTSEEFGIHEFFPKDLSYINQIENIEEIINQEVTAVLERLENKHSELCGATITGDEINRCQYPQIIEEEKTNYKEETK